ncbi:hypothetical protein H0H93_002392 [Arthromyces matolae]|nr:hypothetical protein H0H93_002392 [Arthromyces matolae]
MFRLPGFAALRRYSTAQQPVPRYLRRQTQEKFDSKSQTVPRHLRRQGQENFDSKSQSLPRHLRRQGQEKFDSNSVPRHLQRQRQENFDSNSVPRHLQRQRQENFDSKSQTGPRYLRRQAKENFDSKPPSQHNRTSPELLDSFVLSNRLKKLCNVGNVDGAVELLKNSPRDAQNVVVWNTLIWESMKAERFSLAYRLYVDMKRRGFSPNPRTYRSMFTGLSKIKDWPSHSKQLQNARSLYLNFQSHLNSIKAHDPTSPHLSPRPLDAYLRILGDNRLWQEMFDLYYALPSEGPGAPDEYIYTAMFYGLAVTPTGVDALTVQKKHAHEAKILWDMMLKARVKNQFTIDSTLVNSAILALSLGDEAEHNLAFSISHEFFGLAKPFDLSQNKGSIPLSSKAFDAVLRLCNASGNHALSIRFFDEIVRRTSKPDSTQVLDQGHFNQILKARLHMPDAGTAEFSVRTVETMVHKEASAGKNGPQLRPNFGTYNLALIACWRDADWRGATRLFNLMTGFRAHDFMDGSVITNPQRIPGLRYMNPAPDHWTFLIRTALASRSRANVRQVLRMINHFNELSVETASEPDSHAKPPESFFTGKLAKDLNEAIKFVSEGGSKFAFARQELEQWAILGKLASSSARQQMEEENDVSDFIPTYPTRTP